jgi:hypothetical protein
MRLTGTFCSHQRLMESPNDIPERSDARPVTEILRLSALVAERKVVAPRYHLGA